MYSSLARMERPCQSCVRVGLSTCRFVTSQNKNVYLFCFVLEIFNIVFIFKRNYNNMIFYVFFVL
jgi:hypothetical protein